MGNFLLEPLPLALKVSQEGTTLAMGPPAIQNFKPEILVGIHCTEMIDLTQTLRSCHWTNGHDNVVVGMIWEYAAKLMTSKGLIPLSLP